MNDSKPNATEYVVLQRTGTNTYAVAGPARAHTAVAAAKRYGSDGRYLVVPVFNAHFVDLSEEQPEPVVRGRVLPIGEAIDTGQTSLEEEVPAA